MDFLSFPHRIANAFTEQRLLRQNDSSNMPHQSPEQSQVPVATEVTRSIMGENPVEMAQRANEEFQNRMQRATETALVNLRLVAVYEQAMFDTVKANDDMLSSTAIEAYVKNRNRDLHTSGIHIGFDRGELKISPYHPPDPQLIENRRNFLNCKLQEIQGLMKAYPNIPSPVMAIRRRKERDIQRELTKLDQRAAAPAYTPAGQPQQPSMPMQGGNVAFAVPAVPDGPEQARPQINMQEWTQENSEQLTPAKRRSIETWMEKHGKAETDKDRNIAEGNLRKMGVNVEESIRTEKIQMLPGGGMRLLAFVMGAIQVCSALFGKETAETEKRAGEEKKDAKKEKKETDTPRKGTPDWFVPLYKENTNFIPKARLVVEKGDPYPSSPTTFVDGIYTIPTPNAGLPFINRSGWHPPPGKLDLNHLPIDDQKKTIARLNDPDTNQEEVLKLQQYRQKNP